MPPKYQPENEYPDHDSDDEIHIPKPTREYSRHRYGLRSSGPPRASSPPHRLAPSGSPRPPRPALRRSLTEGHVGNPQPVQQAAGPLVAGDLEITNMSAANPDAPQLMSPQQAQETPDPSDPPQAGQMQQHQQSVPIQTALVPPPVQRVTRPPLMTDAYNFSVADMNRMRDEFAPHPDEGQGDPRLAYDDHPRREGESLPNATARILAARLKLGIEAKNDIPPGNDPRVRAYVRVVTSAASARRSYRNGTELDHIYKMDPSHAMFDQAYTDNWQLEKKSRQKNNALAEEGLWNRVRQWQGANGMPLEPRYDPAEDSGTGLYDQEFEVSFNKNTQNPYEKCRRCTSKKGIEGTCSTTEDNIIPCTLCEKRGKGASCERVKPLVPRIRGAPYMAGEPHQKSNAVPNIPPPVAKTIWNGIHPTGELPTPIHHEVKGATKKQKAPKKGKAVDKSDMESHQNSNPGNTRPSGNSYDPEIDAEDYADIYGGLHWTRDDLPGNDHDRYGASEGLYDQAFTGPSRQRPQIRNTAYPYNSENNRHGRRIASPRLEIDPQLMGETHPQDRRERRNTMHSHIREPSASPRRLGLITRRTFPSNFDQEEDFVHPGAYLSRQVQEPMPAPEPEADLLDSNSAYWDIYFSDENLQNPLDAAQAPNPAPYANEEVQLSPQALAILNQYQNRTASPGNDFTGQPDRSQQEAINTYEIFAGTYAIAPPSDRGGRGPIQPLNELENLLNTRFVDSEFPQLNANGTSFMANVRESTSAQQENHFQLNFRHVAYVESSTGQTEVVSEHKPEEILPGYRMFPKGHTDHFRPVEDKPCENDLRLWDRLGNPQLRDSSAIICNNRQTAACETNNHVGYFATCFPVCEREQNSRVAEWADEFLSEARAFLCLPCGQLTTQVIQEGNLPLTYFKDDLCLCVNALFKGHLCNEHMVNGWKQVASVMARTNVWMLRAASTGAEGTQIDKFCLQCGKNEQNHGSGFWICKCCHTPVIDTRGVGPQIMSDMGFENV